MSITKSKKFKFGDNLRICLVKYDYETFLSQVTNKKKPSTPTPISNASKMEMKVDKENKSKPLKPMDSKSNLASSTITKGTKSAGKVAKSEQRAAKSSVVTKKQISLKKAQKQLIARKRFKGIIVVQPNFLFKPYFQSLKSNQVFKAGAEKPLKGILNGSKTIAAPSQKIQWMQPQIKLDKFRFL